MGLRKTTGTFRIILLNFNLVKIRGIKKKQDEGRGPVKYRVVLN
jgi:hypothetical protein